MSVPTSASRSGVIRAEVRNDEAMYPNEPDRVHYATGVLLGAEDFRAEQQYHRGRLARALQYLHGAGTVAGLQVTRQEAAPASEAAPAREERLWIDAGLAIDSLGRLLELRTARCIRLERWYAYLAATQPDRLAAARHTVTLLADRFSADGAPLPPEQVTVSGVVLDVFLRYFVCERGRTPAFASGPYDALDAAQPSRLRDSAEVVLAPRVDATPGLPVDPFDTLGQGLDGIADPAEREAARRHQLRQLIFGAWNETEDPATREWPAELPEDVDRTSVFLARLVLAVGDLPGSNAAPPRAPGGAVSIDNSSRIFALTPRALAAWVGL